MLHDYKWRDFVFLASFKVIALSLEVFSAIIAFRDAITKHYINIIPFYGMDISVAHTIFMLP